jgi:tripartite-type tricarboxylate transporter receptor subunit TctC
MRIGRSLLEKYVQPPRRDETIMVGKLATAYRLQRMPNMKIRDWRVALICALSVATAWPASAANYPQRPITLVVPFPPGGGTDSIARDLAQQLHEKLGQSIIVDNRGGAGGAIGAQAVAKSKPDGYTLLFVTSTLVTHAATEEALSYDVQKDFAPITMLGRGPLMLVTSRDLAAKGVRELVALAQKRPGEINFCSAGNGSINHLAGELFLQRAGVKMTHVPYKGSGPATIDLLSGRVQVFFATVPTILGHVRGGKVNLLAVTGERRSKLFPETPTIQESGISEYNVYTWWGIVAPARTPNDVVVKLNQTINEAAASERLSQRLTDEGAEAFRGGPAEFSQMIGDELKSWRAVVKRAGVKIE